MAGPVVAGGSVRAWSGSSSRVFCLERWRRVLGPAVWVAVWALTVTLLGGVPAQAAPVDPPVVVEESAAVAEMAPARAAVVSGKPDEVSARLAARLSGERVEILGERSEAGSVFANPDGSLTSESFSGPVRFRDAAGEWVDVDVELVKTAGGGVKAKAHPAGLRLAGAGGAAGRLRELVTVSAQAGVAEPVEFLSLMWRGRLPEPVVEGAVATYPEALPGVDLQVAVTRTGFEDFFIVKERPTAPVVFTVPVRGEALTFTALEDGSVQIRNRKGDVIGQVAAPMMWDAQVDPQSLERVRQTVAPVTVVPVPGGVDLVVAPDPAWMADPATVYPVTVDPSVTLTPSFDAFVQQGYATDQSTATELKLGNNGSGQVARSLLSFNVSGIKNRQILSASLSLWGVHSWSCTARSWEVWDTSAPSTASRWTAQPNWNRRWASSTATRGYSSACADGWVSQDVKALVQAWSDNPNTVNSLGVRATDETDPYAWKRFSSGEAASNIPKISVTYNSYPSQPFGRSVTPCAADCGSISVTGSATPALTADAKDPDGGSLRLDFEVWAGHATTPTTRVAAGSLSNVTVGTRGAWTVPTALGSGSYEYRVRGWDGHAYGPWSDGWARFIVDTVKPGTPVVSGSTWTGGEWAPETAGSISFSSGSTDVVSHSWSLSGPTPKSGTGGAGATTASLSGLAPGWYTFTAHAADRAGNRSAAVTLSFGVGAGSLITPVAEDRTQRFVPVAATGPGTRPYLSLRWRHGATGAMAAVPAARVSRADGGAVSFPVPASTTTGGAVFPVLEWDADATARAAGTGDGLIGVQPCFHTSATDTNPVCAPVTSITLARTAFGASYATEDLGPGRVSLATGDFALDEADVSVHGLTVARTHTTLAPAAASTGADGVFGPGWTASLPAEAGAGDYALEDYTSDGFALLVGPDGETLAYETASTGYPYTFTGTGDATDGSVLAKTNSSTFTLTDPDATVTTYRLVAGAWAVASVAEPGTESTTTYTRDSAGRVTRMLAPVPAGVTCPPMGALPAGCRALDLTYGSTGATAGRLTQVGFTGADPATGAVRTVAVARYDYDSAGRLTAAYDPRVTPALKTTYSYDGNGRVSAVTPPGLAAWTLTYDTAGRVVGASRPAPAAAGGGTATEAVVYDVALTGTGLPTVTADAAAGWAQVEPTDASRRGAPRSAAAVFDPGTVGSAALPFTPAGDTWRQGTITYLDVNGRPVNTATYGAGAWLIDSTRFDQHGNPEFSLAAEHRARALDTTGPPSGGDPDPATGATPAERASQLATVNTYTTDGADLISTLGPVRWATLSDGEQAVVRPRTVNTFTEGSDAKGTYRLLATTATEAVGPDASGAWTQALDAADRRVTELSYAAEGGALTGVALRTPTRATVRLSAGASISRVTAYDAAGRVIRSVMPRSAGADAGTTVTTYYTAGATGGCVNSAAAGLPCRVGPAAQPTGEPIPATTTTYDALGQPTVVTETSGSTTRTSTTTYEHDGARVKSTAITVSPTAAGGQPLPAVSTEYDPATGLATATVSTAGRIATGYDAWGQPVSYTDVDGAVATTSYDTEGKVTRVVDAKGTVTYGYDDPAGGSEHRGLLTRVEHAPGGVFTAGYDAAGTLVTGTWPGGVTATNSYDTAGQLTDLTYTRGGDTLLAFAQAGNVHGQTVHAASPASEQTYTYDALGRLITIAESYTGACTTRAYDFDANSNRTALRTYGPGADGTCQATVQTSSTAWSYDTADRNSTPGYSYDQLGRTRTVPAADVTGGADLAVGYHANDMVHTLTQGTSTKTFTLDPADRIRAVTDTTSGTETRRVVNHYADTSDNPAWIEQVQNGATTWTRSLAGPAGDLAAILDGTGAVQLQFANPHGDIVATAETTALDTGITAYHEQTEYGTPRDTNTTNPDRYGWVGAKERSTDALAGIILMGVRLYNPPTGRFLTLDPVVGGSENAYEYAAGDPIGNRDLDGRRRVCACAAAGAARGIRWNQAWSNFMGRVGQRSIRGRQNTTRFNVHGRTRIPDRVNGRNIGEIKNVRYLTLTSQLTDYLAIARARGGTLTIYVRKGKGTRLSGPLRRWARTNGVRIVRSI